MHKFVNKKNVVLNSRREKVLQLFPPIGENESIVQLSHLVGSIGTQMYNGSFYCKQHERKEQITGGKTYQKKDDVVLYSNNERWCMSHKETAENFYQLLTPNEHHIYDSKQRDKKFEEKIQELNPNYINQPHYFNVEREKKYHIGENYWISKCKYGHSAQTLLDDDLIDNVEFAKEMIGEYDTKDIIFKTRSGKCIVCSRESSRRREEIRPKRKKYNSREASMSSNRSSYQKIKKKAMSKICGGIPRCQAVDEDGHECGNCNLNVLEVDHIAGDGRQDRKLNGFGKCFYQKVLKMNSTNHLEILCADHHQVKSKMEVTSEGKKELLEIISENKK